MLIGNYSVLCKTPNRWLAGSTTSVEGQVRSNFNKSGQNRNRFYVDQTTTALKYYAVPTGYYPTATWVIPQAAGEIGSQHQIFGAGSLAGSIAGGVNGVAALTGSGTISSAVAQLVISMTASLVGSGTVTTADLLAYLNAVAALTGSGSLSATILASAELIAGVNGSGVLASTIRADGTLAADIVGYSALTPEGIRDAVWAAILDSGYSAEELMRMIASMTAANATGLDGAAPVFRDLGDTKDRITATYVGGTRTITSLDPT